MFDDLHLCLKKFEASLSSVNDLKSLDAVRVAFLGRAGIVTDYIKQLCSIKDMDQKASCGKLVNEIKKQIEDRIVAAKDRFSQASVENKLQSDDIDVTLPGRYARRGKIHPISQTIQLLSEILWAMGFQKIDGPDIDTDWNNFTALNIDEHHPARDMHDTFYIKDTDMLLRTHTSNVQIRYMKDNKPPFKIFSIGRVYRADYDATHLPAFHQIELMAIDDKSSVMDLQACIKTFLRSFFDNANLQIRFRSSYFPFTEPSFEVDLKFQNTLGKLEKSDKWLEIMGCGMVHQDVLKNVNIDSNQYQGFALGCGIERLTMLKSNISDLRHCVDSNIKLVNHYGY